MILLIMIILLIDIIIRNKDNSSLISDIFVCKYIFIVYYTDKFISFIFGCYEYTSIFIY